MAAAAAAVLNPAPLRSVRKFCERVLKSPVPVDTEKDSSGPISPHCRQPLHGSLRHAARIRRHSDQRNILRCKADRTEIRAVIRQINGFRHGIRDIPAGGQALCQYVRCFLGFPRSG